MFVERLNKIDFECFFKCVFEDKKQFDLTLNKTKVGTYVTINNSKKQKPEYLFCDFEVKPVNEWAHDSYNELFRLNFKWIQFMKNKFEDYKQAYNAMQNKQDIDLKNQLEIEK